MIFLHVGKTGGSTLQRILYRHFAASEVLSVNAGLPTPGRPAREGTLGAFAALPLEQRTQARLIEGHLIFGIHEFVPRSSTYITLLRDPVALAISQYDFVRRKPAHPLHEEARMQDLDAYVRSGTSLESDNSQTRAISGDTTTPFGECTSQMLDTAKEHLRTCFSVVGLTEMFDASLAQLQATFGWSRLWYSPVNVAPRSASKTPVSASTRRFLQTLNRYDLELHAWAGTRMREAVDSDTASQERIRRIRSLNALYRPWSQLTYHYPRRLRDAAAQVRHRHG